MRRFGSLRSKLIGAFAGVVVVALVLSSTVFILARRGDQEQREIDRVASASPSIVGEYLLVAVRTQAEGDLANFARDAAKRHDVRVLLVEDSGHVTADSKGELTGKTIDVPPQPEGRRGIVGRTSYVTWKPDANTPGSGYVFLASNVPSIPVGPPTAANSGGRLSQPRIDLPRLVIGVPEGTIAHAWLSLLPALGIATAIALPVAVLLAVLFAAYITRPVKQLTFAATQLAEGTFEVKVPAARGDELGDLTRAFDTMARRVGSTQTQMRTLVANVSHDLKTPLTSILGFASALHTGAASGPDAAHAGAIIEDEALRLSRRLDDLLLLSELDSGKAIVEREAVDLGRLATDVVHRLLPPDSDRLFTVELQAPEGVVDVADGVKLERLLENLVDNARKFTPTGGRIAIRALGGNRDRRAFIEVSNTSEEIDSDELARLFDRFYRRDRTRGPRNGSGLGLAIARDLATLQGGALDAAWNDGMLVFSVSLPAEPGSANLN